MPPTTPTDLKTFATFVVDIVNIIIPTIFACLFVFLVWKIFDAWVIHGGDQAKREEGKRYATVAVIVFVVMISVWGIVVMIKQSVFG